MRVEARSVDTPACFRMVRSSPRPWSWNVPASSKSIRSPKSPRSSQTREERSSRDGRACDAMDRSGLVTPRSPWVRTCSPRSAAMCRCSRTVFQRFGARARIASFSSRTLRGAAPSGASTVNDRGSPVPQRGASAGFALDVGPPARPITFSRLFMCPPCEHLRPAGGCQSHPVVTPIESPPRTGLSAASASWPGARGGCGPRPPPARPARRCRRASRAGSSRTASRTRRATSLSRA